MVSGKSQDQLPPGFTEKVRVSNGRKIKIYTELSTGSTFYSRPSITRYLESLGISSTDIGQNEPSKLVESEPDMSLETNQTSIEEEKRTSSKMPDKLFNSQPELSSKAKQTSTVEEKRNSSNMVTIASTAVDGLPPGWIKEIRTSKSGKKIRKDPFYTDPVSGYMFRSFPDALRYLETNDIRNCASKPLRRQLDDNESKENGIPATMQSTPNVYELPEPVETGPENSSAKEFVESESGILKGTQDENIKHNALPSFGALNLEKNSYGSQSAEKVPEKEVSTPQTQTTKSKKRKNTTLPLRSSKRLAGHEPEMLSGSDIKERALSSSVRRSSGIEADASLSAPLVVTEASSLPPPDVAFAKDPAQDDSTGDRVETLSHRFPTSSAPCDSGTAKDIEESRNSFGDKVDALPHPSPIVPAASIVPLPFDTEAANATACVSVGEEILQESDFTKIIPADKAIPGEGTCGEASGKQPEDSMRSELSQPGYVFGDVWSDPCLAFAFKTLTGEIPIEDTFAYPNYFGEPPLGNSFGQVDGSLGLPSEIDVPSNIFQTDIPPESSAQQHGNVVVEHAPVNSLPFPGLGNIGFPTSNGFSSQQSSAVADANNPDYQTKVRS